MGDSGGPPTNCLFSRRAAGSSRRALPARAALGPGVLFPCQPSCLRNCCVLLGNKGFSQHRLSWCRGVSFSYNTWVLRDANLGLRLPTLPFSIPSPSILHDN